MKKPLVREVHPELCFWALNGGECLQSNKHTLDGKSKRLSILQKVDSNATEIFEKACSKVCGSYQNSMGKIDVAFDDVLDALSAAVTAYNGFRLSPNPPKEGV